MLKRLLRRMSVTQGLFGGYAPARSRTWIYRLGDADFRAGKWLVYWVFGPSAIHATSPDINAFRRFR